MQEAWQQFHSLTWKELRTVLWGMVALLVVKVTLALFDFKRVYRRISANTRSRVVSAREPEPLKRAQHLAQLLELSKRYTLGNTTSLHEALVLRWLLRREGVGADLRFGVRRTATQDQIEAMAWVEVEGVPLSDPRTFAPFPHLPEEWD